MSENKSNKNIKNENESETEEESIFEFALRGAKKLEPEIIDGFRKAFDEIDSDKSNKSDKKDKKNKNKKPDN